MINFQLREFIDALADLNVGQTRARMGRPETFPNDETMGLIRENLAPIDRAAAALAMPTVRGRLARIVMFFNAGVTAPYETLSHEIDELFNAVERDARDEFFCHYDKDRIGFLQRMPGEWEAVSKAFPSVTSEIEAGVDCYALGHNTACVFHMARAGEVGLRAIGRERGIRKLRRDVPIEWGTWGQVFQAIQPTIDDIRKHKPNGPKKDAALAFYEPILSDLRAIQSLYRDQTMHLRERYDDGEAQSAMFRTRELMSKLATRLDENSTRAIPWRAWK